MARSFASASSQWLNINQAVVSGKPITMAAWFYAATTHDGTILAITDDDQTSGRWQLAAVAAGKLSAIEQYSGGGQSETVTTVNSYTAGQWHFACCVFASLGTRYVFLDADDANKGTGSVSVQDVIAPTMTSIGARKLNTTAVYFNGRIAHAAIWNAALTASEIAKIYSDGIGVDPRSVRPDSLRAYWPLLENDGDRDWWGQFNLTANNTPTYAQHPPVLMRSTPRFVVPASGSASPTISSVTVSGTRTIGETITANVTSSPSDATKAYRWQKSIDDQGTGAGVITGETSSTLVLTYEDFAAELDNGDNNIAYVRVGAIATSGGVDSQEEFSPWYEVGVPGSGGRRSPFVSQCIR